MAVRKALPVLLALVLCPLAAALTPAGATVPVAHERALEAFEHVLGLRFEPALVRALDCGAVRFLYLWAHVTALAWVLLWVWHARRDAFGAVRDTFVLAQTATVIGYLVYPTAPPYVAAGRRLAHRGWAYVLQSPYAAMPSGHVVFALVAGGAIAALARPWWAQLLGALYPVATFFVILATGNHLWIDGVVAVAVVALTCAVVRARPTIEAWLRGSISRRRATPTVSPSRGSSAR